MADDNGEIEENVEADEIEQHVVDAEIEEPVVPAKVCNVKCTQGKNCACQTGSKAEKDVATDGKGMVKKKFVDKPGQELMSCAEVGCDCQEANAHAYVLWMEMQMRSKLVGDTGTHFGEVNSDEEAVPPPLTDEEAVAEENFFNKLYKSVCEDFSKKNEEINAIKQNYDADEVMDKMKKKFKHDFDLQVYGIQELESIHEEEEEEEEEGEEENGLTELGENIVDGNKENVNLCERNDKCQKFCCNKKDCGCQSKKGSCSEPEHKEVEEGEGTDEKESEEPNEEE